MRRELDVEKALIAACLIDPDAFVTACEYVNPDSFSQPQHQDIFRAMLELDKNNEPIDLVTLGDKVDSVSYLTGLHNYLPSAANAEQYAKMVQEKSQRTEIRRVLSESLKSISKDNHEVDDVVSRLDRALVEIMDSNSREGAVEIGEAAQRRWEQYEEMYENDEDTIGYTSGYDSIDSVHGGFMPGEQTVLAARPSMGKSALAVNIALRAAERGVKVAIFSLEMSTEAWIDRALADSMGIDGSQLKRGKIGNWEKVSEGIAKLDGLPIHIDDTSQTTFQIRAVCRRIAKHKGLDLVVVDYLGLLQDPIEHGKNYVAHIGDMSKALRSMGKDYDGSILLLHQLNRANEKEGRRPRLSDLRDSGEIEQHADVVWFLHPDKKRNEKVGPGKAGIDLIVAKQRHGQTPDIPLVFEGKYTRFAEIDWRYHD